MANEDDSKKVDFEVDELSKNELEEVSGGACSGCSGCSEPPPPPIEPAQRG